MFQYSLTERMVPVPVSVPGKRFRRFRFCVRFLGKRFRRFRFPVPVRFLGHPEDSGDFLARQEVLKDTELNRFAYALRRARCAMSIAQTTTTCRSRATCSKLQTASDPPNLHPRRS